MIGYRYLEPWHPLEAGDTFQSRVGKRIDWRPVPEIWWGHRKGDIFNDNTPVRRKLSEKAAKAEEE